MQHVHVNIPVKDLSKKKNIPVKASWHVQSQVSEDINKHAKKRMKQSMSWKLIGLGNPLFEVIWLQLFKNKVVVAQNQKTVWDDAT